MTITFYEMIFSIVYLKIYYDAICVSELRLLITIIRISSQCYAAYIHPRPPRQLFQLSETQLERFSKLYATQQVAGQDGRQQHLVKLPFTLEPNARRVDHIAAFRDLNIYRDRYERNITYPRWGQCMVRLEDRPELSEFIKRANKMFDVQERERDS